MAAVAAISLMSFCAGAWGQGKTPRPALLVLSKEESFLAIVDPATLKVVGKVDTGAHPHEVATSDDGKYAMVTNYGAHADGTTLSLIDLDQQKEVQRVDLAGTTGPHGIVFAGGKFYFTTEGSRACATSETSCTSVRSFDPGLRRVDWALAPGQQRTHMIVFQPGAKTCFLANIASNTISVVDISGAGGKIEYISVGKGPEGIDISPDEKEVWAANSGDGTVSIVDLASKKVTQTVDVRTKHSNRLKFTPDGKLVLISDLGSGNLLVVDAASRKEVKRLNLGKSAEGILVQPDGARAFVAVSGDDKVAAVDLKTLEVTTTFALGKDPDGMAWRK
jgi:YVTN family beta-propeller protein